MRLNCTYSQYLSSNNCWLQLKLPSRLHNFWNKRSSNGILRLFHFHQFETRDRLNHSAAASFRNLFFLIESLLFSVLRFMTRYRVSIEVFSRIDCFQSVWKVSRLRNAQSSNENWNWHDKESMQKIQWKTSLAVIHRRCHRRRCGIFSCEDWIQIKLMSS